MAVSWRSTAGIAAIWVATVAGASATAWVAIDQAGRGIADASLSSVNTQSLGATTPGSSPSPTGATPEPSVTIGTATAASQTPVDKSSGVPGGQLSVRCTGEAILLRIAQPSNGWRVDVAERGPQAVDVVFERGGEDAELETRVKASCENGTPVFSVTDNANGSHETGEDS